MGVRVFVGGEFFDRMRRDGCYYADKTEILYELVHDANNMVTLFTRPRRFGKTLMMSMMESFFDIRRDSKALFEGLDVTRHEDFSAEWMNKHPVLFITLKDAESLTFKTAYAKLKNVIADACKKHPYLLDSEYVDADDRDAFMRLKAQRGSESDVQNSLLILTRMMASHYGKPAVLLIDEYDVPLAKASEVKEAGERYYPQMLEVIRGILSTALKSNDYLRFAVVTGCLRIAKESIFTGVNNFASYSVLDRRFSTYFGFTEEEVQALLQRAGLEERMGLVRSWYDGYVMGNAKVFCPWVVLNYVADAQAEPDLMPKNYWKNTSGNGIIRSFIEQKACHVKPQFEVLLNGGTITRTVSDELTYDSLHDTEDNLWSVLLMTGYLTKADPNAQGDTVALRIPNLEIARIFQDTVARYFSDQVDDARLRAMMGALWSGDEAVASKALSDFLWDTISYMDYSEDYYHAVLAGIFVGRGYSVESNRERGLGRPDIQLIDDANRRALIIEAKRADSAEHMGHACDEALRQIVDNEYAKGLDAYQVFSYGVAFYKKTAMVKKL